MQSSRTKLVTYSYPFTQNKEILGGKVKFVLLAFFQKQLDVCVCMYMCVFFLMPSVSFHLFFTGRGIYTKIIASLSDLRMLLRVLDFEFIILLHGGKPVFFFVLRKKKKHRFDLFFSSLI